MENRRIEHIINNSTKRAEEYLFDELAFSYPTFVDNEKLILLKTVAEKLDWYFDSYGTVSVDIATYTNGIENYDSIICGDDFIDFCIELNQKIQSYDIDKEVEMAQPFYTNDEIIYQGKCEYLNKLEELYEVANKVSLFIDKKYNREIIERG